MSLDEFYPDRTPPRSGQELVQWLEQQPLIAWGHIRNLTAFIKSLPDWSFLDGCCPGTIRPTDIDGCIERNGVCLWLEHKLPTDSGIDPGQMRLFKALAKRGDTVIIFWSGAPDGSDTTRMSVRGPGKNPNIVPATQEDIRAAVVSWFNEVEQPAA